MSEKIFSILKKQPDFPLRAPFCCLIEYKGYTALAKLMPALDSKHTINPHQLKGFGSNMPLFKFTFNDFSCHGQTYTLAQPHTPFKISQTDTTSLFQPTKDYDFLTNNRQAGISLSVEKLTQDAESMELFKEERLKLIEVLSNSR